MNVARPTPSVATYVPPTGEAITDTANVQAALTAGKVVALAPARYDFNARLTFPPASGLVGAVSGGTIVVLDGGVNDSLLVSKNFDTLSGGTSQSVASGTPYAIR